MEAHTGAVDANPEAMKVHPRAMRLTKYLPWIRRGSSGALHAHPDAFFKRKKLTHCVAFFAFTSRFPFHLHLSYFCFKEKRIKNFP